MPFHGRREDPTPNLSLTFSVDSSERVLYGATRENEDKNCDLRAQEWVNLVIGITTSQLLQYLASAAVAFTPLRLALVIPGPIA